MVLSPPCEYWKWVFRISTRYGRSSILVGILEDFFSACLEKFLFGSTLSLVKHISSELVFSCCLNIYCSQRARSNMMPHLPTQQVSVGLRIGKKCSFCFAFQNNIRNVYYFLLTTKWNPNFKIFNIKTPVLCFSLLLLLFCFGFALFVCLFSQKIKLTLANSVFAPLSLDLERPDCEQKWVHTNFSLAIVSFHRGEVLLLIPARYIGY